MENFFETQKYIRQYTDESVALANEINCFLGTIDEADSMTLIRINMLKEKAKMLIQNIDTACFPEITRNQIVTPIMNELMVLNNLEKKIHVLEEEKEKSKNIEKYNKTARFRKEVNQPTTEVAGL